MGEKGKASNNDKAWEEILCNYPIEEKTRNGGVFEISSKDIKKFREPRLMTKFDTSESVAAPLRKLHLNILPTSRHSYAIGRFKLYKKFPDMSKIKPKFIEMPDYETLRVENITSESNAINALIASKGLARFLEEDENLFTETFNGRMGSGNFSFNVDLDLKNKYGNNMQQEISVNCAQLEIDGGFESPKSVSIMEAKNIINEDFNIRQLYFPYRKYEKMVDKKVRLIFSQYTNSTYYLYEYIFTDINSLSSIELLNKGVYTFEDQSISESDINNILESTNPIIDDDKGKGATTPFVQADKFDRIISLLEHLVSIPDNTMTTSEVAEFLEVVTRQAAYYPAAGEYLEIFDRSQKGYVKLTDLGLKIGKSKYRDKQLMLVEQIFKHKIFHQLYEEIRKKGCLPDGKIVMKKMKDMNVCDSESTIERRSRTVISWLEWIFNLVED
ncbi:type II restriction enzyme [Ligilactobacillus ruminis]|uniref:Uncharacterized protein n=2 Tax=Ligilactobacillus ruminis TaxID=1623 RepID=A0A837IW95_9LACO|nr:hypothetical protein [Ligilactobacillus ruminis]KLA46502.1 hypothetical protein LRB_821 [Ligilactobacillus ruminis]KRM81978.1 hypothetical protein FC25_GL001363 [Ligilactobacillus ruminis DSM 20403 = NBRC 102161]SFG57180.1 hypothetical protein SAMN02910432_01892 [Ligilactobacillus ruminis DSM 20403 = NBRC 102161]